MNKKGLLSVISGGLLASMMSVGTVHAESNAYEAAKKSIVQQKQMKHRFSQSKVVLPPSFNKKNSVNLLKGQSSLHSLKQGNFSKKDDDYLFETEYNDSFKTANSAPLEKLMVGQLLPLYDVDMYKVSIPNKGLLIVGGINGSYNISLGFGAFQKDFVENNNLTYLGYDDSDPDVLLLAYQVNKPGTYYINAIDIDNLDDVDNNTEEDIYGVMPFYVDNVAPSKPTINKIDDNDKVIKGKAEANSTVTVRAKNKTLGTKKVDSKGNYSVSIKAQKKGTNVYVYAKDKAGNKSKSAVRKVVKH